jgi:hypothetical protein
MFEQIANGGVERLRQFGFGKRVKHGLGVFALSLSLCDGRRPLLLDATD